MSDNEELYQVLYLNKGGENTLTDAMSEEAAKARAEELDAEGYEVGSIMTVPNAAAYMRQQQDNPDGLFRVKYKERGVPGFQYTKPMSREAAEERDKLIRMTLGSDVVSSVEVVSEAQAATERTGSTFPIQEYLKSHRDVEPEVDDSLETPEITEGYTAVATVATDHGHDRVRTRHLAMELALEMYGGTADQRTAGELVGDAEEIWKFLNG